jgi:hypothetical protein
MRRLIIGITRTCHRRFIGDLDASALRGNLRTLDEKPATLQGSSSHYCMKYPIITPLSDMLFALAGSALQVQRRFDAEFRKEQQKFIEQPAVFRDEKFPGTIAPACMTIDQLEIRCLTSISNDKSEAWEIKVVPLNLSYNARYSISTERQSSVSIIVERTPFPKMHQQ